MLAGKLLPFVAISMLAVACWHPYGETDPTQADDETAGEVPKTTTTTSKPTSTTVVTDAGAADSGAGGPSEVACSGNEIACLDFGTSQTLAPFAPEAADPGTCTVENGQLDCHEKEVVFFAPPLRKEYDFDLDVFVQAPANGTVASVVLAQLSLNYEKQTQRAGFYVEFTLDIQANGTATIGMLSEDWGVGGDGIIATPSTFTATGWHHIAFQLMENNDSSVTARAQLDGKMQYDVTNNYVYETDDLEFGLGAMPIDTNAGPYDVMFENVTVQ